LIGTTVSHYRIVSKLGQGGMGVVYVAEDTHLARRVAIKFCHAKPENTLDRGRFLREARAASALNHPHIAGIYDYGETDDGQPFLVMELVRGEDLFHLLRRSQMPVTQAIRIAKGVAEALGEAHRHGIVHRDIKPSNVMITERGTVKVLDFGLAKLIHEQPDISTDETNAPEPPRTIEGTVLGTPLYMSPEQARNLPLGAHSDVFSLGAVFYECLTGRPAFEGSTAVEVIASVLHVTPPPPSQFNPRVNPETDRVVARAMAKDPAARYASADEMAADLEAVLRAVTHADSQETELIAVPRTAPTTVADRVKQPPIAAATVLLVLLASLVAWWFLRDSSYQPAPETLRWYREGVAALRDGTYYKASKALERAAGDPRFAMAHARLAEAWMELDYSDRAKEEMLRAAPPGSSPRLSRAEQWYVQAVHLTLTGDFAGAAAKYREIEQSAPDSARADALVDLGRAFEKNEKLKDAVDSYLEATRRQPQDPPAWLRLAILYGRQLDQAKAAAAFREAESLYRSLSNLEGVAETVYQRGILENKLGRRVEARVLLQQALDMSRSTGSLQQQIVVLLQLSDVAQRTNEHQQAEQYATQALELARVNGLENLTTRGLIDLGNAYFVRSEFDEAKTRFTQSLEYARRYHSGHNEARALLSLGSLQLQRGETADGLRNVEQALDWYRRGGYRKETAQALILVGRARRDQGDYAAALDSFQQQLQIARALGDQAQAALALEGLGTVLEAQEHWPDALIRYREGYEAARGTNATSAAYALVDQASVLWQLGRYDEAGRMLEQVGSGVSRGLASRMDVMRAAIALSQRQFPAAIAIARRLLAQGGLRPDVQVTVRSILGRALADSGKSRDGLAAATEAEDLAVKLGRARLIAEARLARAEVLLASGALAGASEAALAAQPEFAREGLQEPEWRCWSIARDATRASAVLTGLEQKWGPENFKTYLARPDVQFERTRR
jgi:serine/threonine protein kinase